MRHGQRGRDGGRGGGRRDPAPDDPVARERAREALHRALDRGEDPEEAARAALRLSEECVEAWILLSDCAVSPDEWRHRVRRAVEAATRVLGEQGLREGRGRMGTTAEGADYLHALAALARTQVSQERAAQAVQTLQGVLAMDPSDPVQVRGEVLLLLLGLGRDDEAEDLVAAYPEDANAEWLLGRALLRRRRALDEEGLARATEALDRAVGRYPQAAAALLPPGEGERRPGEPGADPVLRQAFEDTEGALDWLRERLAAQPPPPRVPAREDPRADRRFVALECAEEAWEASGERREALARAALEAWPDCAEAWRAVATTRRDLAGRVEALRAAVAAGRRALGHDPDGPASPVGDDEDARALLRARAALADALHEAGDLDGAVAQDRALLLEDPDDPLGRGVPLVARLLAAGRDAEAAPLVEARREDASPGWAWARVLAYRRAGDTVAMSFALGEATMVAPFVGALLLTGGRGVPPEDLSADALHAARRAAETLHPAWEASPGALAWLADRLPRPPPGSRRGPGRPPPRR